MSVSSAHVSSSSSLASDNGTDKRIPDDVVLKGFRRCQQFLGGAWTKATVNDFRMEHIRGGLSNLLYCCSLSDNVPLVGSEPRQVLLRVYGQIIRENPETVLTDSVIFGLLAEKKFGPQLLGVFTDGRVEEFVPSRHLRTEELHDPEISVACAHIMAQFHKLQMPIVKEPKWLSDVMTRYLAEALNNVSFDSFDQEKQEKLNRLLSYDLAKELTWLEKLLRDVDSPVVYCHNDLQEGNILYVENESGWHVRPIDFEYSSYNYRGFDIGNHFCEWCYSYDHPEPPYYVARLQNFPNREQQLRFIRAYLKESSCQHAHGDCEKSLPNGTSNGAVDSDVMIDEEEKMLIEVNTFALASHFMWGLWAIVQSHISNIQFGYLDYALDRFNGYFEQKRYVTGQLLNGFTVLHGTARPDVDKPVDCRQ